MATVNPTLENIQNDIRAFQLASIGQGVTTQTLIDNVAIAVGQVRAQTENVVTYTGLTAELMAGVHLKLDAHTGLLTEIRDKAGALLDLLDVMNNNAGANWQQLLTLMDIMITNNAINHRALVAAVCGDCEQPLPPIESGGASCRSSTGGYTGNVATVTLPITWYISPGLSGIAGDTVRFRLNSITKAATSVTLYEGPGATGTAHALSVGGDYAEFVLSGTTSSLVFEFPVAGPFNFNFTLCVIPLPE